jgi:hypothetical protein
MKVIIFIVVLTILHLTSFGGLFLIWLGLINTNLILIFLIAIGLLILIDIIFGLYYLIKKPPTEEGTRYRKLNIEEADKRDIAKKKK